MSEPKPRAVPVRYAIERVVRAGRPERQGPEPPGPFDASGGAGVREPRRPRPAPPSLAAAVAVPEYSGV